MNILLLKESLSNQKTRLIQDEIAHAYQDFEGNLLRRALYKTSDFEVSQDLVQVTFLKTIVYLQKGGKINTMKSFLNHVLNDLVIDEYRKHKSTSLDVLLENGFEPSVDNYQTHINYLDGKKIILLVSLLPAKYEVVVRLRYIQGLSLGEIALMTKQSENTVAVQVHRGLEKLKKIYDRNQ
jgi:RNA polymerase sigma-70 factor (ECF subfamily)